MKPAAVALGLLWAGMAAAQALNPGSPAAPPALGRLFFTPEQREQLDLLRSKKVTPAQTRDDTPPEIVSYGGLIRRSDGSAAVWVNNRLLSERELRETQSITGRIGRDGQLQLGPAAHGQSTLQLKVGQRVELQSGQIRENVDRPSARTPTQPASPGQAANSPSTRGALRDNGQPSPAAGGHQAADEGTMTRLETSTRAAPAELRPGVSGPAAAPDAPSPRTRP
jgi:hypothetical protein